MLVVRRCGCSLSRLLVCCRVSMSFVVVVVRYRLCEVWFVVACRCSFACYVVCLMWLWLLRVAIVARCLLFIGVWCCLLMFVVVSVCRCSSLSLVCCRFMCRC